MTSATNSIPAMLLRPCLHEKPVVTQASGLFRGYHVGASAPSSVENIVRESGKPSIVDPHTYLFTLPPKRLLTPETTVLRPSVAGLVGQYGAPFSNAAGTRPLSPLDFSERVQARKCVERVVEHQRVKLSGQMPLRFDPYYDKYRLWDDDDDSAPANDAKGPPQVLVPPYFYVRSPDDPWLRVNVELAEHALAARRQGELVYPIVLFGNGLLKHHDAIDRIALAYLTAPVDGFLLWPNDFVEERASLSHLQGLLRFVERLAQSGKRVSKLYGGFLSALLSPRGLRSFSCGLGTGSSKNAFAYGGRGGPPKQKFYVAPLHRSFDFDFAKGLLEAAPKLRCSCGVCKDVYGRKMEHFESMGERGRCEIHFLHARKTEMQHLASDGLSSMAVELKRRAGDSLCSVDTEFLRVWADAIA